MADYSLGGGFGNDNNMGGGSGLGFGGGTGLSGSNSEGGYGIGGGGGDGLGFSGGNSTVGGGYDFGYNPSFSDYGYNPATNYSLGDLYGQDSGLGFNPSGGLGLTMPASDTTTGLGLGGDETNLGFWDGTMGKFLKGLGMFAVNMNPAGRALSTAYGIGKGLVDGNYGQAAGGLTSALTGNGLMGTAVGLGTDALLGKDVSQQAKTAFGSGLGSMFGGQVAGPVGAFAGGTLGAYAANNAPAGYNGSTGPMSGGGNSNSSFGAGDLAGGLAGLWAASRASSDARKASNAMSSAGVQKQLGEMFGQNSPYATQLRQELARKDAASGHRSQYGTREVELQAKLAQLQTQNAPSFMNANTNAAQQQLAASQAKRAQQNAMLANLLQMGKQSGAFNSMNNWFSQGQSPSVSYSLPSTGSSYGLQVPSSSSGGLYSLF